MIILALIIILPLCAALLACALPARFRFASACASMSVSLALAIAAVFLTANGRHISVSFLPHRACGLNFYADGFASLMGLLASVMAVLLVLCSRDFFNATVHKKSGLALVSLFFASCLGAFFSGDLLTLFVCQEAACFSFAGFIAACLLPAGIREKVKLFLATGIGTVLIAVSFLNLAGSQKELLFEALKGKIMSTQSAGLILAALLLRALFLPLGSVRQALARGSLAITCFFTIVFLLQLCVSAFTRLFYFTFFTAQNFSHAAVSLSAALLLAASCFALIEKSAARFLIFAALAQFGNIMFLLASANALSVELALLFVTAQSLGLAGIFLSAQEAIDASGSDALDGVKSVDRQLWFAGAGFLLSAFSVVGIPPLAGFWPKALGVLSSVQEGRFFIEGFALLAAVISLFYYLRAYRLLFLARHVSRQAEKKGFCVSDGAVFFLVCLCLCAGVAIKPVLMFFNFMMK